MPKAVDLLDHVLTDLESVRDFLRLEENEFDDRLIDFINQATGLIEARTRRKLLSRGHTFMLDGTGSHEILVTEFPVTAVVSARWFSAYDYSVAEAIDTAGWVATAYGLLRLPVGYFPAGRLNVELVVTAGYLAGTHKQELSDLGGLAKRLVRVMYQEFKNNRGAWDQASVGRGSVTFKAKPIEEILDSIPTKYLRF